jgi:cbb3-type cytochrome c oxidase subunit I
MSFLKRDNAAATTFIVSAAGWLVIGTVFGLLLTIEFVFPDFARGISQLVFSRLREAHVNTVLFAWLSGAMMGIWLYIVPRLTGRKIYSEPLGMLGAVAWNISVAVGIIAMMNGQTQSREYAEMIWGVDVAVMVVLISNAFNILMTIRRRVEPKLYVSLWFIIATVVLFPVVYFIGNVMWAPPTGALIGINDATVNWFYGHNVLGLWFTTGLLAVIYYIVPKETGTPLYSASLSLIAFWGTLFFYTGVGAHHLLWAPIPPWLKTVAVAESIGMVIPVLATMFNIMLTMRGNWSHVRSSVPLLYVLTGWATYILVSFQGSNEALPSVNQLTHFTQYVPGHAMLGLLFFSSSVCIAGAYYVLPRALRSSLYSRRLARAQYALYVIGFAAFFLSFLVNGAIQGTEWVSGGLPIWTVLPALRAWGTVRIMGGALVVTSFVMFAYNIIATVVVRPPFELPNLTSDMGAAEMPTTRPTTPAVTAGAEAVSL